MPVDANIDSAGNPMRRRVLLGAGAAGLVAAGYAAFRGGPSVRDERFIIASNLMPPDVDFSRLGGAANAARPLTENFTEALVDKDFAGNPRPGLAEWEFEDGARTAVFHLRPGVTFHNGMPFVAEDVKFSHDRMLKFSPSYRGRVRELEAVEVAGPSVVRFRFARPARSFVRSRSLFVFSKRYYDSAGEERFRSFPMGTGPYRLTRFQRFEYADLDAFEDYWGGPPTVKRARFAFVPEDMSRVAMLRSGEADMITATPLPLVRMLEQAGYRREQAEMHPTFSIRFQLANQSTPWADLRVRRAIAHAIDSASIIRGLFGGIPHHFGSFAPGELGHDPAIAPYAYDPAKARALLAEAGHAQGFDLPLTYWAQSYYGIRETAEAVVLYLRAVGIRCALSALDATQQFEFARSVARDPKARVAAVVPAIYASSADPVEAMRQGYYSKVSSSWYHSAEFDALLEKVLSASTDAEQDRLLRLCARQIHDDLPIIPLWNNVAVYMMRPGVAFRPTARDVPSMMLKHVTVA